MMTILWINLCIVFLLALCARVVASPGLIGPVPIKTNNFFLILLIIILVLISGLRNNIGDTSLYMHAYEINNFTWKYIYENKDFGFSIIQMLLQKVSFDPQILIFTTALITNVLIVLVLNNYSRLIELSLYVYITGGLYLVSMNGIRQFLAAAIIFAATKYIFNGEWKKYILVILFASTIHQSALILIPIYFLIRQKAWSKSTFLLLFVSLVIVAGYNQFSEILFSTLEDTQYGHYQKFSEGGANIIRVAVNAVPLIIAFIGKEKLREVFPKSDYIVNMSLLGLLFLIVSTQNWIFARFIIYFGLYQLILISWIVKVFKKKDQKFLYFSILLFYFIFYYYECVVIFGTEYRSDFIG